MAPGQSVVNPEFSQIIGIVSIIDCMVLQWTPKCLAMVFCARPLLTIAKARLLWFSLSHGMEEGQFSSKLKCFSWRIEFKQTFYTSHLNLYRPVNLVLVNTSKNDMYSLTIKSPCIWVGNYPMLSPWRAWLSVLRGKYVFSNVSWPIKMKNFIWKYNNWYLSNMILSLQSKIRGIWFWNYFSFYP